jgi:hypothetical protein
MNEQCEAIFQHDEKIIGPRSYRALDERPRLRRNKRTLVAFLRKCGKGQPNADSHYQKAYESYPFQHQNIPFRMFFLSDQERLINFNRLVNSISTVFPD